MIPPPRRICHVSPHLPPDQAANALLPVSLGMWSVAAGDAVTFVAHSPAQSSDAPVSDQSPTPAPDLPGPVRWIPRRRGGSRVSRLLRLGTLRTAREIHSALSEAAADADLLHLHSNGLIIEVAAAWARRRNIPAVLTLYGTEIWHYEPRRPFDPFRRAYDGAAEVTFYSQGLLDHARSLGLGRPGLSVVYPAVREAFRAVRDEERAQWRETLGLTEPLVILNVKRLHELAGQDVLIDAFARVAADREADRQAGRRDVRLVICGTGPQREALERQVGALGLSDRVTFTGLVSNDLVARYAAVADVFALPSRLEALPTVAVEALAAGTPVVSADHPGGVELHEMFGDDVLVVPRENVAQLARALADALDRPRRSTTNTQDVVRQRFSPNAVRAAYDLVYTRALVSRRGGRV